MTEALAGTGVVVRAVLPGLERTPITDSVPVRRDVLDEDRAPAEATAQIADVAAGRYDDRSSALLDAVALHRR